MIPLTLTEIARITEGDLRGDADLVVTGPAFVDSRRIEPGGLFVAVPGEHVDGHDYVGAAHRGGAVASLVTRDVEGPHVKVADPVVALARLTEVVITRLQRDCDLHVVGITGSQGKTGTKDLLAQLLEGVGTTIAPHGSFNNDLGVPLTALRAEPDTRFLIIEMGARGVGHIARLCAMTRPQTGVVLNVGDAHAAEFGSREATARAKGELPAALPAGGLAVLNADDPMVAAMASPARRVTYGRAGDVRIGDVELQPDGTTRFTLQHGAESVDVALPLLGAHLAHNAAAAAAVALEIGLDLPAIATAVGSVRERSPMRMEHRRRDDGLLVVNDAYNANPESMLAALETLVAIAARGRRIAVLGEMLELGSASGERHRELGRHAAELGLDVVAVGDGARAIADGAGPAAVWFATADEAVATLAEQATAEDVVLVKASRAVGLERVAAGLLSPTRHTS